LPFLFILENTITLDDSNSPKNENGCAAIPPNEDATPLEQRPLFEYERIVRYGVIENKHCVLVEYKRNKLQQTWIRADWFPPNQVAELKRAWEQLRWEESMALIEEELQNREHGSKRGRIAE
jgi:hypothetical protein